jgi:hypothetical protein
MQQVILTVLRLMKDLGYEGKITVEEYEKNLKEFEKQVENVQDETELAVLLTKWLNTLSKIDVAAEVRRDRFSW